MADCVPLKAQNGRIRTFGPGDKIPSANLPASSGGYDGDPTVIQQDPTHRFATDAEKTGWDGKAAGNHNHDASYSAIGHNHSGTYEPANANIQQHIASTHAPAEAQKNSDITKAEIEAKLTGEITTHTHPAGGGSDGEAVVVATQDTANATVNLANATGLVIALLANSTYIIEGFIVWNSTATTVGIKLSATGPTSPTIMAGHFITDAANGTPDSSSFNGNDVTVTTSASMFTTGNIANLACIVKTGANAGNFQLRFAAETTGTVTIKTGSTLRYRKVA